MNNDSFANPYQNQGPAVQPAMSSSNPGPAVQPVMPPSMQGQPAPAGYNPYGYMRNPQDVQNQPKPVAPKNTTGILTALAVLFGLGTVIFVVLFIWMAARYSDLSGNFDTKVKEATITAVDENTAALEAQFAEREKTPYNTYAGPADYGEVTFEYPKTWSVYEYADASNGGEYGAVFNPGKVSGSDDKYINALRFTISSTTFENAIKNYENQVKSGELNLTIVTINGASANLYTGTTKDGLQVAIAIIKIRDKTVEFSTDAISVFENDFNHILSSIKYNA